MLLNFHSLLPRTSLRRPQEPTFGKRGNTAHKHGKEHKRITGFTLIELMIALTILAILITMASFGWRVWIVNGQIRAASGQIADILRAARAEALQRNRRVTVQLCGKNDDTSSGSGTVPMVAIITLNPIDACSQAPATATPADEGFGAGAAGGGSNSSTNPALARKEIISSGSARVGDWSAPIGKWSVTFNPLGRAIAYPNSSAPDPANNPFIFEVDSITSDVNGMRPMRVIVYESGQILVCDTKVTNAADPRACPA